MQDLLEANELLQKGIGAETILKIYRPLVERRRTALLARLVNVHVLQDFLEIQAEAKAYQVLVSELDSMVREAEVVSNTLGAAPRGRNS